jgi:two-component system, NtrC family, response regulator HydG
VIQDARILVVDDNPDVLSAARLLLKQHFSDVATLNHPGSLAELARTGAFDVLLLDMNFSPGRDDGQEGLQALLDILAIDRDAVVIPVTAHSDVELAVEAMKKGAADFVTKPWENERLLATLHSALALKRSRKEAQDLREANRGLAAMTHGGPDLIGTTPAMLKVFAAIARAAPTDANVLILGENGTGKELVAREIHRRSSRASNVFMRVDLGALQPQLFESELFGHKKGAFTDAKADRVGYFRAARGGTLFLDEIGNVALHLQAKLLTALERREVVPVGAEKAEMVDVRLISATNIAPERLHDENFFRPDLLYRINTVEITLPPLRDRVQDIPLLLQHFAGFYAQKYNLPAKRFGAGAMERLMAYAWPGNVRALRHAVERAVILGEGELLTEADFPLVGGKSAPGDEPPSRLDEVEKAAIIRSLEQHGSNVSRAARALGLTRTSLYRRMEKYGL